MNEYRGKHAPSQPWPVASTAAVQGGKGRHRKKNRRKRLRGFLLVLLLLAVRKLCFKIDPVDQIFALFFAVIEKNADVIVDHSFGSTLPPLFLKGD